MNNDSPFQNYDRVRCLFAGGLRDDHKRTSQTVAVETVPSGADCNLLRNGQLIANIRDTPRVVTIGRSVHDVIVKCSKPGVGKGEALLKTNLQPMVAGNILVGGVIGAGVDAASGAMNEYPGNITVRIPSPPVVIKKDPPPKFSGDGT